MTFQYMIWRKDDKTEHLVFNQKSLRIVYPPSHNFYRKPVQMAVMAYEHRDWKMIDNGAWKGDHIDKYMEAMRKMYPKALPTDAESK